MAANLFSRLEKFREESQVMVAHWSIALNDESSITQSVSHSVIYVGIKLLGQLTMASFVFCCCRVLTYSWYFHSPPSFSPPSPSRPVSDILSQSLI